MEGKGQCSASTINTFFRAVPRTKQEWRKEARSYNTCIAWAEFESSESARSNLLTTLKLELVSISSDTKKQPLAGQQPRRKVSHRKPQPTLANLLAGKLDPSGSQSVTNKMSKTDIRNWVAAAASAPLDSDYSDSDSEDELQTPIQSDDAQNWAAFLGIGKRSLMSSRTKLRVHFLNERLLPLVSKGGVIYPISSLMSEYSSVC